ncbi:hypothetical protein KR026_010333 [Drosophila bipectinata]|nr:hypothetical protein KR026_010333 [Drosophila bipectinata]
MIGSVRATLLGLVLQILVERLAGQQQQFVLARPQRSLYEPLEHLGPVAPLGWNTIPSGGGLGLGTGLGLGEWSYNPIGLGHMSKDELLTLLEAWKEVEQESATTTAAPPPPETTTSSPVLILPPPSPPPPRPIVLAPAPAPAPVPQLPAGTPITVRLPAFVPVRLAAMFTPPAGGAAIAGAGAGPDAAPAPAPDAAAAGGDDLATDDIADDDTASAPRLFRFMAMPRNRNPARPQSRQQFVVRNTLDSVDAGTAPLKQAVKPITKAPAPKLAAPPAAPSFRPRFGSLPPHLANARFELVPSSQIIGDWRE